MRNTYNVQNVIQVKMASWIPCTQKTDNQSAVQDK